MVVVIVIEAVVVTIRGGSGVSSYGDSGSCSGIGSCGGSGDGRSTVTIV